MSPNKSFFPSLAFAGHKTPTVRRQGLPSSQGLSICPHYAADQGSQDGYGRKKKGWSHRYLHLNFNLDLVTPSLCLTFPLVSPLPHPLPAWPLIQSPTQPPKLSLLSPGWNTPITTPTRSLSACLLSSLCIIYTVFTGLQSLSL